ncbi:RNA polymerase sigma factor [Carboxylicivirga sp. RSCT41]|uniref:RNA polymerase sigma factor n=1 Tax=Carboxylicivirga agarovorans TaxID=3417570 RepID=UPI003D340C60
MKTVSDDILIEKSRTGNSMAFGVLVERYSNYCYSIVCRIVGNRAEAEDVVQDAFVLAWQEIDGFDCKKGKFTTWLYTIATRLAIDILRKRRSQEDLIAVKEDDSNENDALKNLFNEELEEQIKWACKSLTALQKAVFVLREIEEMDVHEVSEITGLSAKQIKDNLYVARKKVREQLQKVIRV